MSSSDDGLTCIEGHLWRNVMLGFWSKRFCRLEENKLSIFKKKSDKKAESIINMTSLVTTEITDASNNKFKLNIPTESNSEAESVYLQASSKNEMMKWILDLRSCAFTNPKLTMDAFKIISVIGRGCYGKVMLCQKKDTQELLAIKTVHKSRLVEANKLHTILTERNILSKVKNPFIVSLNYAFQTVSKFYLCLEYAPGGDLFHLLTLGIPPTDDIKLYIAELSIAINDLHKNGIIYRDIKPENILFDEKGHIKLTDFGLSKDFNKNEEMTTMSFCGTTEYMAPEMIKKAGYGKQIDWWGLGIVAYEMFFGMTPFEAANKRQMYQNILKAKVKFPKNADENVVDLIKSLLRKNPKKRGNFETIKKSKLFKNFDFDAVFNRQIPPLYVPEIDDPTNPNNFDPEFTKEMAIDSVANCEMAYPMVSKFSFSCLSPEPMPLPFPDPIPLIGE
ncbi:RAC family serine/threonine-protein kinase like protein [Tritrichomonas foetus]|uniref:RAC family serine/threonine-protein kinase like protein n=1 Tax=Tritrichomonas foetus TaxID=1144522 RepID=A0A1J4KGZ3_9EUKA|nr:RAC family serine/threonine-protein kinase like protein [Tritrichomonas foetus]|eukprot:OHT10224.1 RAC family serine/threonine-protein kinase like protein [Tritrichomonas foetus]